MDAIIQMNTMIHMKYIMISQDHDPFAEHRVPRVTDRDNEYQAARRPRMQISPERFDPFAPGTL